MKLLEGDNAGLDSKLVFNEDPVRVFTFYYFRCFGLT